MIGLDNEGAWIATEVLANEQRMPWDGHDLINYVEAELEAISEDSRPTRVFAIFRVDVTTHPIWVGVARVTLVILPTPGDTVGVLYRKPFTLNTLIKVGKVLCVGRQPPRLNKYSPIRLGLRHELMPRSALCRHVCVGDYPTPRRSRVWIAAATTRERSN
jgi:hypothetical protein